MIVLPALGQVAKTLGFSPLLLNNSSSIIFIW